MVIFTLYLRKLSGLGWTYGYKTLDLHSEDGVESIQEKKSGHRCNILVFGCCLLSAGHQWRHFYIPLYNLSAECLLVTSGEMVICTLLCTI